MIVLAFLALWASVLFAPVVIQLRAVAREEAAITSTVLALVRCDCKQEFAYLGHRDFGFIHHASCSQVRALRALPHMKSVPVYHEHHPHVMMRIPK